jgi:hypothetical protein
MREARILVAIRSSAFRNSITPPARKGRTRSDDSSYITGIEPTVDVGMSQV